MATVIYDAGCGFCRWCLAVLLRADRRRLLRPLPLGSAEAERLLADLTPAARAASWHLVDERGERASAAAALAPALALLAGGAAPARILERVPGLTEWGYGLAAAHRGRLGRLLPGRARRWADGVVASREAAG